MKFSIITVVYNSESTLARTIESVLNQTYKPYEYFVIDGASTDGSLAIAQEYTEEFKKSGIKYTVISEKDNGMYDALNKGARLASGDFIGQINSDDWYELDALEKIEQHYSETPFDMAFADLRMVKPNGKSWIKTAKVTKLATTRHWNHPTQITKREIILEKPYACYCMCDDLDLMLWIRKHGYKLSAINQVVANFTMEGMSHKKKWKTVVKCIKDRNRIYKQNGYSRFYAIYNVIMELAKFIL